MPESLPVLIVGAGIGGLTLALALARRGQEVVVLEKRTALEEAGAGIQLSPNASRVLIDLGLGRALTRAAAEPVRLTVRSGRSGDVLASSPLGAAMRERYGAPYCLIHRADLQMILLDALRSTTKMRLHFGRGIRSIDRKADRILVTADCVSGSETFEGRALIGADGIWSKTAALAGDASEPVFRGHVAWRGTLETARVPADIAGDETGLWLGPGAHLVHYPIRNGSLINVVAAVENPIAERGWSRHGDSAVCRRRFRDWPEPVRALIDQVDAWLVWSLFDRSPRKRWSKGRMTLLGDAAHPVLPYLAQGGALAIEDAAVLAGLLGGTEDVPSALLRYEAIRKPRASRVQAAARSNGRAYHLGFPLSVARDLMIRRSGAALTDRYSWIHGWRPDSPHG
jgi:salicylate hydroxylase